MLTPDNTMPTVRVSELEDNIVPEATYNMRVHRVDYVAIPKKANASPYIHAWHVITGPASAEQYLGRIVFANYPIQGRGGHRLRDLLEVTGHDRDFELKDPVQLIGLEFSAIVGIEKSEGYPDKNVVKRHLPLLR
jgi:hypothetical protein